MRHLVLFSFLAVALTPPSQASDEPPSYPASARRDTADLYFGTLVADPRAFTGEGQPRTKGAWPLRPGLESSLV